jgi:hypothetical protein
MCSQEGKAGRITNNHCKNKAHPQSDGSVLYPLTILEMNLVATWQPPDIHRFLKIQSGVSARVLMSPNAMANISLCWHKWKPFLPHICHVAWIWCLTNTQHSSYAWIIALALQKFQSFEDVVDHPIQRCIPHYSLQPRCTPAYVE